MQKKRKIQILPPRFFTSVVFFFFSVNDVWWSGRRRKYSKACPKLDVNRFQNVIIIKKKKTNQTPEKYVIIFYLMVRVFLTFFFSPGNIISTRLSQSTEKNQRINTSLNLYYCSNIDLLFVLFNIDLLSVELKMQLT